MCLHFFIHILATLTSSYKTKINAEGGKIEILYYDFRIKLQKYYLIITENNYAAYFIIIVGKYTNIGDSSLG